MSRRWLQGRSCHHCSLVGIVVQRHSVANASCPSPPQTRRCVHGSASFVHQRHLPRITTCDSSPGTSPLTTPHALIGYVNFLCACPRVLRASDLSSSFMTCAGKSASLQCVPQAPALSSSVSDNTPPLIPHTFF